MSEVNLVATSDILSDGFTFRKITTETSRVNADIKRMLADSINIFILVIFNFQNLKHNQWLNYTKKLLCRKHNNATAPDSVNI